MLAEKKFVFSGREVTSRVISVEPLPEGGHEVTVDSACIGPDGRMHHQTNTTTFFNLDDDARMEAFLCSRAEWLSRLIWERPEIVLFVAQLQRADGNFVNLTCVIDITQPRTIIPPDFVGVCKLPRVGSVAPEENTSARIPVHRATFRFGNKQFTVDVLSLDTGAYCIIGSDLVLQAAGKNSEYLFDLFSSDVVRALRNAARAKQNTVLTLGSYSGGNLPRLQMVKGIVARCGCDPVLVSDFADIPQQSLYQKMLLLGSLSRFIICDESVASGHLIELQACADIKFVTALLRPHGKAPTWMNEDIAEGRDYMRVFPYESDQELERIIPEAITWAQKKVEEQAAYYNAKYPWRSPNVRLA